MNKSAKIAQGICIVICSILILLAIGASILTCARALEVYDIVLSDESVQPTTPARDIILPVTTPTDSYTTPNTITVIEPQGAIIRLSEGVDDVKVTPADIIVIGIPDGINTNAFIEKTYAEEIVYLAKTVWGEAVGCTTTEQAQVIWSILNRVDHKDFPDDIIGVVTQPGAFHGYSSKHPVNDDIYDLVVDVLYRWSMEDKIEDVGRVLPSKYVYFHGDGVRNHFRDAYTNANYYDNSLPSPYEK